MQSMQCNLCNAIYAIQSVQCNLCNVIYAMQTMQCDLCSIAAEAPFAQQYDVIFEHMTTVSFILGVDAGVIYLYELRSRVR